MSERTNNDRLPPFAEAAERGVLGSILIDPEKCLGTVISARVTPVTFYAPSHQHIFRELVAMAADHRGIDLTTFTQWLRDHGSLEAAGGEAYIEKLADDAPTTQYLESYLRIVQEKYMRRCLIDRARGIMDSCYYAEEDAAEILASSMATLTDMGDMSMTQSRSNLEVYDALRSNWQRAHDLKARGELYLPGLETPYRRFNEITGGLQKGLWFFGGKSSSGKTTMITNICWHFALNKQPGLMIQLDDCHEDVMGRLAAMLGSVSLSALAQGFAKQSALKRQDDEVRRLIQATQPYLHIIEECQSIQQASAIAKYYYAKHKIKWLIIDYVQLLGDDEHPRDDERIRLGHIAVVCKRIWKQLGIPVILVSQAQTFKDHEDDGRKADMSDLFGASALYQAATGVFICKEIRERASRTDPLVPLEMAIDATGFTKKKAVALHCTKNKHGPKGGMISFWMLARYFRFEETPMVGEGSNARQATWEEVMSENAQYLATIAAKPDKFKTSAEIEGDNA